MTQSPCVWHLSTSYQEYAVAEALADRPFVQVAYDFDVDPDTIRHAYWRDQSIDHFILQLMQTAPWFPKTDSLRWRDCILGRHVVSVWIHFSEARDDPLVWSHLAALRAVREIRLDFSGARDAHLARLVPMKSMEHLSCMGCFITDEGLRSVSQLSRLVDLSLYGNPVTDRGVHHLAKLRRLRYLSLDATNVSDAGVSIVANMEGLQLLSLGKTDVTDAGVKDISRLARLEILNLRLTPITDACIDDLSRLAGLKELDVRGTWLSRTGVAELQRRLPRTRVQEDATESWQLTPADRKRGEYTTSKYGVGYIPARDRLAGEERVRCRMGQWQSRHAGSALTGGPYGMHIPHARPFNGIGTC
jgi:hypothetical protein